MWKAAPHALELFYKTIYIQQVETLQCVKWWMCHLNTYFSVQNCVGHFLLQWSVVETAVVKGC